jgi:DNA invertase Pin-like site-specific DNA recombinase
MYVDKATGTNTSRPELQAMLSFAREGDVVYFESISRLARNTRDFLELMDLFKARKVDVVCLKEPIDTTTPAGRMIMTVFAAMYEMEWENIKQRQREGIEVARARGKRFGRPRLTPPGFGEVYQRWRAGKCRATEAMTELGMTKSSFYRRVMEMQKTEGG